MKPRTLVLVVLAAIVVFVAGLILYGALAADTVEYMGLKYGPSEHALLAEDELYFTGVKSGGAKLYAAGWESPQKVPPLLFTKDLAGTYHAYYLSADNPPVYAYTPYSRYNLGEPVTIGLMNDAGGTIKLSNSAPLEIQQIEGGEWKTVYQPVAAQVITPVENGTFKEWTWEQTYSGGGKVGEGDYRAVIDGRYEVYFTITKGAPVARADGRDYGQSTVQKIFFDAPPGTPFYLPEHSAFADYYRNSASRGDIAGEMAFKAWMKSLPADKLHSALKSIMPAPGGIEIPYLSGDFIPRLAIHATFSGKPSWFIAINWGMGGEKLDHIKYYVIEDETGKEVYYLSCK